MINKPELSDIYLENWPTPRQIEDLDDYCLIPVSLDEPGFTNVTSEVEALFKECEEDCSGPDKSRSEPIITKLYYPRQQ